jgi:hypothetical protein
MSRQLSVAKTRGDGKIRHPVTAGVPAAAKIWPVFC